MAQPFKTLNDKLQGLPAPGQGFGKDRVTDDVRLAHEAAMARAAAAPKDEEIEKGLGGELVARWKIELTFIKNRTSTGLNAVGIQVWESGKHFHGGGDALAFFCEDAREGHADGCGAIIPQDNVRNGVAYCSACKKAINASYLANIHQGIVYIDSLAKEVAKLFRRLGSNADIFIKFHKEDIRYMTMMRAKGPEYAAKYKGMHIYPLKNIVKDTANGADLVGRIKAFLLA